MKQLSSIKHSFIEDVIQDGIDVLLSKKGRLTIEGSKSLYFVGQTLCIDVEDDTIMIYHNKECFHFLKDYFFERMLTIRSLVLLEELMTICGISHEKKWTYEKN